jgi:tRNA threonylcarbamoyladenosine biosynthesis protein TsaB
MIEEVLAEAGLALRALDGLVFGRGPGSFTGVRVAASVTQGLALGADLPVLGISDLRALAAQARRCADPARPDGLLLAAMDARMGEIYWGVFDARSERTADALQGERVGAPSSLPDSLRGTVVAAAGRGLSAYPGIATALGLPTAVVLGDAEPDAADIVRLAAGDLHGGCAWRDAAEAQPVYLRDQVVHVR